MLDKLIGGLIGGFLGFITAGPLGAIAGFVLGAFFEQGGGRNTIGNDNSDWNQWESSQRT